MAKMTNIGYAFVLILAMNFAIQVAYAGGEGSLRPEECGEKCAFRCSKADHHKETCNELCNMCCAKCLCVPSGTFGNKEECPCYNNWKTQQGTPKCP